MPDSNVLLVCMLIAIGVLLAGYTARAWAWGIALMLAGIVGALCTIGYGIYLTLHG